MKSTPLVSSTEQLVAACSERIRELESLAVIIGQGKEDDLADFSSQLSQLESVVGDVMDKLRRDMQNIERAKLVKEKLNALTKRLASLDAHLSKHVDWQAPSRALETAEQPNPPSVPVDTRITPSDVLRIPSAASFETIPRYMRTRLTHAELAKLCAVLNQCEQPVQGDQVSCGFLDSAQVKSALQCLLRLGHLRAVQPGVFAFCEVKI